jgi:hypothetical protein
VGPTTGQLIKSLSEETPYPVEFSPDGQLLLIGREVRAAHTDRRLHTTDQQG